MDDPGWSRSFGFIYLNDIYNIPDYSQRNYSDPNLFYFQPKWCKHIYAAMWDLNRALGDAENTGYWLPQPNDEPSHPAYKEMFEKNLKKQVDYLKRERDFKWWLKYGPTTAELPNKTLLPDNYVVFAKITNTGTLKDPNEVLSSGLTFSDISTYSPFVPVSGVQIYNGGFYASGQITPGSISGVLDGKLYASGAVVPVLAYPINGGIYS